MKGSYTKSLPARLDTLRKEKRFCDFTVQAGGYALPVHRCVIAAGSEYFNAMLSHDTKENRDGLVNIWHLDPKCVAACVDFMYSGEPPKDESNPVKLLEAASYFRLQELRHHMITAIIYELNYDNVFCNRRIAKMYGCERLLSACDNLAIDKFHEFAKSDAFKEIDADYLMHLITSKHLKVFSEVKCKAIMIWVKHNSAEVSSICDMLKHIDIANIEPSYRKCMLNELAVSKAHDCVELVSSSIREDDIVNAMDFTIDCSPAIIMCNVETNRLERFDLNKRSWIGMHPLRDDMKLNYFSLIVVDAYLYVINLDVSMHRIKLSNMTAVWEDLSPPPYSVDDFVVLDGMIYGYSATAPYVSILRYDLTKACWQEIPKRTAPTVESAVAVARDMMFVIGGKNYPKLQCVSSVECFDPLTTTWCSPVCNLNVGRADATACMHKGAIYVFGGCNGFHTLYHKAEVLYPDDSSWTLLKLPGSVGEHFQSHSLIGKIYLVGLDYPGEPLTIIEFDPETCSLNVDTLCDNPCRDHPFEAVIM